MVSMSIQKRLLLVFVINATRVPATWRTDGEFYQRLEQTGVLENTVKTFTADDATANEHFLRSVSEPVVIKNVWTRPPFWDSKEAFLMHYGNIRVPIRWPMGTRQLGLLERLDTIRSYANAMNRESRAGMVFGSPCGVSKSVLCSLGRQHGTTHSAVAAYVNFSSSATSLSMGPSRQGLPWHNHNSNWEAVACGLKLFLFQPPISLADEATLSRAETMYMQSTQKFIFSALKDSPATTHVLLEPGDVLFIPCNWWHATVNIGETLAVGTEHDSLFPCKEDAYATAQENLAKATTLIESTPQRAVDLMASSCHILKYHTRCFTKLFEALYIAGNAKEAIETILHHFNVLSAAVAEGRMGRMPASVAIVRVADLVLKIWPRGIDARVQRMQRQLSGWVTEMLQVASDLEPSHNVAALAVEADLANLTGNQTLASKFRSEAIATLNRSEELFWYREPIDGNLLDSELNMKSRLKHVGEHNTCMQGCEEQELCAVLPKTIGADVFLLHCEDETRIFGHLLESHTNTVIKVACPCSCGD